MGKHKRSRSISSEESDDEWMRRKMRRFQEKMENRLRKSGKRRGYEDRHSKRSSRKKYRDRSSSSDSYHDRYCHYGTDAESQKSYSDESYSGNEYDGPKQMGIERGQMQSCSSARDQDARGKELPSNTEKSKDVSKNSPIVVAEKTGQETNTEQILDSGKNTASKEMPESEKLIPANSLSAEELKVIGNRIDPDRVLAPEANEDLVVRIQEIIKKGLPEEEKKVLLAKFPPPKNCLFLDPPKINAEVKAALQEAVIKRDLRITETQQKISAGLGGLMNLASFAFTLENEKKLEMLGIVSNLLRIFSDLQFEESAIRRNLILKNIDASLRETLNSTQVGEWLFGENLEDRVKTSKALATSSVALKLKKQQHNNFPKNLKGPVRRQPQRRSFPQTGQNFTSRGQKQNYQGPVKKTYNRKRN